MQIKPEKLSKNCRPRAKDRSDKKKSSFWKTKDTFNKSKDKFINKNILDDKISSENESHKKKRKTLNDSGKNTSDVMSNVEKETVKNPAFLQKEIDTRNTNYVMTALIIHKTSMSIAFSKQCWWWWSVTSSRSTTFHAETQLPSLGSNSSFTAWHSDDNWKCSQHRWHEARRSHWNPKTDATAFEMFRSSEKETGLYLREQDELIHWSSKQEKFRRDLERDEERVEQDEELERAPTTRRKIWWKWYEWLGMVTTESLVSASSRAGM